MKLMFLSTVLLQGFAMSCSDGRPVRSNRYAEIEPLNSQQSRGTSSNQSQNQEGKSGPNDNENSESGAAHAKEQVQEGAQKPENEQGEVDQSLALQSELDAAQLKLQALESTFQEKSAQVQTISEINQEFCALYLNQAKSCIALRKLIVTEEQDETKCIENGSLQNPFLSAAMTVELKLGNTAVGTQFELVANDVFVSSPIANNPTNAGSGTVTGTAAPTVSTLTWKVESGSSKTTVPALFEIKKLALRVKGGATLPKFSAAEKLFTLKVGGQTVLDSDDLNPWSSGEFKAVVNSIPLLGLLSAPECSITEKDLSEISRSVRSRTDSMKAGGSL